MILLVSPFLVPNGYRGLAFFPFVFVKYRSDLKDAFFLNHEQIHLRQQVELLIIPFYIWYGVEFCLRWIQYRNPQLAYRNISFEREAYAKEKSILYLKNRPFWLFLKWI